MAKILYFRKVKSKHFEVINDKASHFEIIRNEKDEVNQLINFSTS